MMAKITKGSAFAGAVKYIFDPRKQTELLAAEGVRLKDVESVARSFEAQRQLNTRVTRPVGHISLDFSAQDREQLDNAKMVAIAREYMERMGIRETQFIIGRHHDREHPHIHLLYNHVDNNGCTISDRHDRVRSTKICRELTEKHGLYISGGKENVKRNRLREPDATKYRIYDALVRHVPQSASWEELQKRLRSEGIELGFKTKGSTSQVEGVRFTMNNLSFNGSKVDRQSSYGKTTERSSKVCHLCNNRSTAPNTTKAPWLATPSARSSTYRYYQTALTPKRRRSVTKCNARRRKKESDYKHLKIKKIWMQN